MPLCTIKCELNLPRKPIPYILNGNLLILIRSRSLICEMQGYICLFNVCTSFYSLWIRIKQSKEWEHNSHTLLFSRSFQLRIIALDELIISYLSCLFCPEDHKQGRAPVVLSAVCWCSNNTVTMGQILKSFSVCFWIHNKHVCCY